MGGVFSQFRAVKIHLSLQKHEKSLNLEESSRRLKLAGKPLAGINPGGTASKNMAVAVLILLGVGIFMRISLFGTSFADWFAERNEVTTPLTSWNRGLSPVGVFSVKKLEVPVLSPTRFITRTQLHLLLRLLPKDLAFRVCNSSAVFLFSRRRAVPVQSWRFSVFGRHISPGKNLG